MAAFGRYSHAHAQTNNGLNSQQHKQGRDNGLNLLAPTHSLLLRERLPSHASTTTGNRPP